MVGGGGHYNNNNDTTFTKIFVGGLAWETQRDTMRRYFEQFGEILEAVVITDKNTGRSKGYGFVSTTHMYIYLLILFFNPLLLLLLFLYALSFLLCLNNYSLVFAYVFSSKVTFKDPESAVRACQNPSPVIDGRRANCNLASLGANKNNRPPTPQYGPLILSFVPLSFSFLKDSCHILFLV